ncbi:MAG: hypothetical protein ABWY63_00725 [Hyphomicrobiaceae bacterium]
MTRFLQECHARSHYAGTIVQVDVNETKRLLGAGLGRHGHKGIGACWLQVADNDGQIDGLMYATLARVYAIGDHLMATDLFWATNGHAQPTDALALMRNMLAWAKSCPLVVEVHIAASAVITDRPSVGRLLKAIGMQDYGAIYRLDLGAKQCLDSQVESQRFSVPSGPALPN